jgi:hypothetical protein
VSGMAGRRRGGAIAARRSAGGNCRGGGPTLCGVRRGAGSTRGCRITAIDCETKGDSPLPIDSGRRRPAGIGARATLPRATTCQRAHFPSQTIARVIPTPETIPERGRELN